MTTGKFAGSDRQLTVTAFPSGTDLWRIGWMGPVDFPDRMVRTTQPSVRVHLNKVVDPKVLSNPDAHISPDALQKRQERCWVSVGTTVLLRVGDLWQGKKFFHRPALDFEEFQDVDVDATSISTVKSGSSLADGSFLLPYAEHPWHSENTHSYCISVRLKDDRLLVIPAMELIRFYFGSSAKLLSKIFLPPLAREDLYESKHLPKKSRKMTLNLASGMSSASAADIARIAGDQQAWLAALEVGSSCLRAKLKSDEIYPQAKFPFIGRTNLKVHGQWLSRGPVQRATFLVYRMVSCSHAFPFESLFFTTRGEKASSYRGDAGSAGPGDSGRPNFTRGSEPPKEPSLEERDASSKFKPHSFRYESERVFPYLDDKPIRSRRNIDFTGAAQPGFYGDPVSSLAVGDPGSSARRREAQLAQSVPDAAHPVPDFLKPVLEACKHVSGLEIELLTGGHRDGWTVPVALLLDEDGVIDDWFLMTDDGSIRPRRLAALLVSRGVERLTLVFIESDPLFPLIYPSEKGDDDEAIKTMKCAAEEFLQRKKNPNPRHVAIDATNSNVAAEILQWISQYFH